MTPEELALAAHTVRIVGLLSPTEREALRTRGVVRSLPAGDVYLREGDMCRGIALLLEGRVRVAKTSPSGREITLYHVGPGETCILTTSCLTAGAPFPAVATVVEATRALLVPPDLFRHYMATSEAVRSFVIGGFGELLANVMALVEEIAFGHVDTRLAAWLTHEAHKAGTNTIALTHDDIAAHVGTARVVVSRILESFADKGWIALGRRRVEIHDAAALAAYGNRSD